MIDTSAILGTAEAYLLITRLMGWDLNVSQDWLTAIMARLVRIAEKNS